MESLKKTRDHSEVQKSEMFEIEAERSEMKRIVMRALREAFTGILAAEVLDERIRVIDDTQFLTEEEFAEAARQHPNEAEADGIMRVEVNQGIVRRYAVVKHTTRAATLHTLAHEATHLLAPESNVVFNPMRENEGVQVYSVYLGPLWHNRFVVNGEPDPQSIYFDKPAQRALFWEAVTDWNADDVVKDEFDDREKEEVKTSGYVERHYIAYLVDHAPDRDQMVQALRLGLTSGSEDEFRWALQKITRRADDQLYEDLLDVLGHEEADWEGRVDLWMQTVNSYFSEIHGTAI